MLCPRTFQNFTNHSPLTSYSPSSHSSPLNNPLIFSFAAREALLFLTTWWPMSVAVAHYLPLDLFRSQLWLLLCSSLRMDLSHPRDERVSRMMDAWSENKEVSRLRPSEATILLQGWALQWSNPLWHLSIGAMWGFCSNYSFPFINYYVFTQEESVSLRE